MRKKLKSFVRDKNAITPVLSSLLLTIVAIAAMALATAATYVITNNLRENMSERAIVEDLWVDYSTSTISIYLRNVGKVALHISTIYVNHTSQIFTRPYNLEIEEHKWLNVSQSWESGNLYYVDIVTTRGTHIGGYYKAT